MIGQTLDRYGIDAKLGEGGMGGDPRHPVRPRRRLHRHGVRGGPHAGSNHSSQSLPVVQALRYAVQIADALAWAHEPGIVHRDLKPSNVIVTPDDRVKIVDFGLAKLLDRTDDSNEVATRTSPLTDAGIVVGTAA